MSSKNWQQYLNIDSNGLVSISIPAGEFKSWLPGDIYKTKCSHLALPFLQLLSFPTGGRNIENLTHLLTFDATGNQLTRLPESFGTCQHLVKLNLSFNHLEKIPEPVFQLVNLTELDLSENDIMEVSPSIVNLKQLRNLNLSGNLLDDLPPELSQCENIEKLNLSRKWYPKGGFTVLPAAVCFLSRLVSLDVSWHQISTITDEVSNLTMLEDLRMCGNYLKYVSTAIAECRHLKSLDLTGAMKLNSFIPPEIFTLPELELLDLTNNYFSEIPPKIVGLVKLKIFIIRRNALLRIPDELFQMENLESVDVSENYLEEIPPSVSNLKTLRRLNVSFNKITRLPDEICQCKRLMEFQAHCNKLESLPQKIHKLSQLEELNLDGNKLKTLPLMLDKLEMLEETERLSLYNNCLEIRQQAACDQGVQTLFPYLRELRIQEAVHRQKLILIGASKAGKSSLRNVLLLGRSKLTQEDERTWVMEQHLWEPEPDLRVQILDFGGHHIYSVAHHMYLTPDALHVLVFDISIYEEDLYDTLVGDWLEAIMDLAPGAKVMMVGTHADLCSPEHTESAVTHIQQRMHREEAVKVQDFERVLKTEQERLKMAMKESGQQFPDLETQRQQERVQQMEKLLQRRVKLPNTIFVVSCAEVLSGIINFHENLISTLKSTVAQKLPHLWYNFLIKLQARTEKIVNLETALEIFCKVLQESPQSNRMHEGSSEHTLDVVLRYLHVTGEIVWFYENPKRRGIVFHHPETLVEMLRAIFRHDFREVVNFIPEFADVAGITESQFEELKDQFLLRGLMTVELLNYILQHFRLSLESRETFIDLMLKFDLCYEVNDIVSAPGTLGSSRVLHFPWFHDAKPPVDYEKKWPAKIPANTIELQFRVHFLRKNLPNFFEKLSARLQSYVTERVDWKDGILAERNRSLLILKRKKVDGRGLIVLSVRGADLQELWFLVLTLRADMLALLQEWPFVKVDMNLVCFHCLLKGEESPYLFHGDILNKKCPESIHIIRCPKSKDEIPACTVRPLDPEFHAKDLDKHMIVITDFLRRNLDVVDSGGLLSDLSLNRIAAELGFLWHSVMIELKLTQSEIKIIQMDYQQQSHRMITQCLFKWKEDNSNKSDAENIADLLSALERAGLRDLADQYREDNPGS